MPRISPVSAPGGRAAASKDAFAAKQRQHYSAIQQMAAAAAKAKQSS